jgi:hypothetical protein
MRRCRARCVKLRDSLGQKDEEDRALDAKSDSSHKDKFGRIETSTRKGVACVSRRKGWRPQGTGPKVDTPHGWTHRLTMCKVLSCKVNLVRTLQGYQNTLEMLCTRRINVGMRCKVKLLRVYKRDAMGMKKWRLDGGWVSLHSAGAKVLSLSSVFFTFLRFSFYSCWPLFG